MDALLKYQVNLNELIRSVFNYVVFIISQG